MTTTVEAAAREAKTGGGDKRSIEAKRVFEDLMALDPDMRRDFIRGLDEREMVQVFAAAQREGGTPFALYIDDALGFVEDVLGENTWSISREILRALPVHPLIAVPSCFSSSKSWTLSRATLWFSNVHPVGTARVVTLAPLWRQVSGIMWGNEIRGAHARSALPGEVGAVTYKIKDGNGVFRQVAEGIVGNPRNEATTQGLHAPNVLVLVDEAGGISHGVGRNLRALLTAEGTQMVLIGNPPADNEGSWFEDVCGQDNAHVIPISALSTPNFTGERVPRCRSCPPEAPRHTMAKHLVKKSFVADIEREFGKDSPYYQAKVLARFPRGGSLRIIPSQWVEDAVDAEEPEGEQFVRLCDLGLSEETAGWKVKKGAWVRLGIDIASDGGDEFVISRAVGDLVTIEHISTGSANQDSMTVAGKILEHIRRAQLVRAALGTRAPVRVKIDAIGLGWGPIGTLKAWGSEGLHDAQIVGVNVAEGTGRDDDKSGAVMRPYRKRDEMWIATRGLLQPRPLEGLPGLLRLRVDRRTQAQLTMPGYKPSSTGQVKVESKREVKARLSIDTSPDRAEALLLALYEPLVDENGDRAPRLLV
jgi:hypothetical protein